MGNKAKTHRASAKRLRRTRTGKVVAHKAFKSHLLSHKSRKRKRRLGKQMTLAPAAVRNIRKILPNG
jgi:large subunit ribosomal protein L35